MSDIVDEMGGYLGDGSEIELPPQIKGKLEYQSTRPVPEELNELFWVTDYMTRNRGDGRIMVNQAEFNRITALITKLLVEAKKEQIMRDELSLIDLPANFEEQDLMEWRKNQLSNLNQEESK